MSKHPTCPACSSAQTARIVYEFRENDPELQLDLKERRAVIANHPRTGHDPSRRCLKCGYEWDYPRGQQA